MVIKKTGPHSLRTNFNELLMTINTSCYRKYLKTEKWYISYNEAIKITYFKNKDIIIEEYTSWK